MFTLTQRIRRKERKIDSDSLLTKKNLFSLSLSLSLSPSRLLSLVIIDHPPDARAKNVTALISLSLRRILFILHCVTQTQVHVSVCVLYFALRGRGRERERERKGREVQGETMPMVNGSQGLALVVFFHSSFLPSTHNLDKASLANQSEWIDTRVSVSSIPPHPVLSLSLSLSLETKRKVSQFIHSASVMAGTFT